MNKHFEELAEHCGTYIAPHNNEVTWKEIDFLCEHVVRECADWVMANVVDGQLMRDRLLARFELSGYDDE